MLLYIRIVTTKLYMQNSISRYFIRHHTRETVWHFKNADSDHIKRSIDIFDWEFALNYLDGNDHISAFNSTIVNTVTNFIPNETITCDDRGPRDK